MFIPLRTDRAPKRRPVATEALIVVNLLVYLTGAAGAFLGLFDDPRDLADWGHFDPRQIRPWQLLTYQFLHDPHGILHVLFNMLFLWVFGCAVEGRLGRAGFAAFYLVGGAVAALAHALVDPYPVIGASGSVAAVTGAFLALFPRSRIQVLVLFFVIGLVNVPSLWFIGLYFAIDLLNQIFGLLGAGGGRVAYTAHIAGYLYGFAIGFLLLATGVLKREEFDVFFLFTQARRRSAFRAASRGAPSGPWGSAQADTSKRLARQAARRGTQLAQDDARVSELRDVVVRLLAQGDLPAAAGAYRALLAEAPAAAGSALPEPQQIDVASQLYAQGDFAEAASAYELLLARYPGSTKADEVRLMLGLIYARRLDQPQRARPLIAEARARLKDRTQAALADDLLAELGP